MIGAAGVGGFQISAAHGEHGAAAVTAKQNAGIEVVYIKASQGSSIKDAYFDVNYENAKNNGLKVWFYHFLTATNEYEAEEEARFFASVISGKVPDCKLVMDYEAFDGSSREEIDNLLKEFR